MNNQITYSQTLDSLGRLELNSKEMKKKPFEMNTYVQLEIDNNNCNCIPRVCKFCITNLNLNMKVESIVIAVKLHVSKRSMRTVEIPITKYTPNTNSANGSSNGSSVTSSVDLNLNYNITYPHFIKKDSNILYIYIQKRKKYKNRPILGYKTIAYSFIDLASVLQREFTNDLPLVLNNLNSIIELINFKNNKNRQVIGSLRINSLVSQPIEILELKANNESMKNELEIEEEDLDELNEYLMSRKSEHTNKRYSVNYNLANASDSENDKDDNRKVNHTNTKLTDKIISFLRKIRNDNESNPIEAIQNDENMLNDDEFDEMYDIEQISDYTDSDNDPEQDAYSIISTPKPKLQPFYSNFDVNSNKYYADTNSTKTSQIKLYDEFESKTQTEKMHVIQPSRKLSIDHIEFNFADLHSSNEHSCLVFMDENDPILSYLLDVAHESKLLFVHKNKYLKTFIDALLKYLPTLSNKSQLAPKFVVMGDDQYLNRYLQTYVDLLKTNESTLTSLKHYFIGRGASVMSSHLCKCSSLYASLFGDEFWQQLDQEVAKSPKEVLNRLVRYVQAKETSTNAFQIGEVMINEQSENLSSKSVPFLCHIRIGFSPKDQLGEHAQQQPPEPTDTNSNQQKNMLTTSSSVPQFNLNQSPSQLVKQSNSNRLSPPISPISPNVSDEFGYNLQLDYWTVGSSSSSLSSTFSTPNMLTNITIKEMPSNKVSKSSMKAFFKSLQIHRTQLVKSNMANNESSQAQNLTIVYVIKEKRQKSISFKSTCFFIVTLYNSILIK